METTTIIVQTTNIKTKQKTRITKKASAVNMANRKKEREKQFWKLDINRNEKKESVCVCAFIYLSFAKKKTKK